MTLVVSIQGREAIWLLADRRLSYRRLAPRDDGRKVMCLETSDGIGIVGYAGLGATAVGTEPADWMVSVLRGRNILLEKSIEVLAGAMEREFPRHLSAGGRPHVRLGHVALIPAFAGNEMRLYSVDIRYDTGRRRFNVRAQRHLAMTGLEYPPRIGIAGSGEAYLRRNRSWCRPLLNLVRGYDDGKVNARTVADHMARLNEEVHRGTPDATVGPRCVVVWRNRTAGLHKGGGAHQFYTSEQRDGQNLVIPTIGQGVDVSAVVGALMPYAEQMMRSLQSGQPVPNVDHDRLNQELARIPSTPDERLK